MIISNHTITYIDTLSGSEKKCGSLEYTGILVSKSDKTTLKNRALSPKSIFLMSLCVMMTKNVIITTIT